MNSYDHHIRNVLDATTPFDGSGSSDRIIINSAVMAFAATVLSEGNPSQARYRAARSALDAVLDYRYRDAVGTLIEAHRTTPHDVWSAKGLRMDAQKLTLLYRTDWNRWRNSNKQYMLVNSVGRRWGDVWRDMLHVVGGFPDVDEHLRNYIVREVRRDTSRDEIAYIFYGSSPEMEITQQVHQSAERGDWVACLKTADGIQIMMQIGSESHGQASEARAREIVATLAGVMR